MVYIIRKANTRAFQILKVITVLFEEEITFIKKSRISHHKQIGFVTTPYTGYDSEVFFYFLFFASSAFFLA